MLAFKVLPYQPGLQSKCESGGLLNSVTNREQEENQKLIIRIKPANNMIPGLYRSKYLVINTKHNKILQH